jgi:hypothetical protein
VTAWNTGSPQYAQNWKSADTTFIAASVITPCRNGEEATVSPHAGGER